MRLPFPLPASFAAVLPCADCPGIDVTLTLYSDGRYAARWNYRERGTRFERGLWHAEEANATLAMEPADGSAYRLRVRSATSLEPLSPDGKPISGPHESFTRLGNVVEFSARDLALAGEPTKSLAEGPWTIVELDGGPIVFPAKLIVPTLNFEVAAHRVGGSAGCNRLTGPFSVAGPGLRLGPLATTRMTCGAAADALERGVLAALAATDAYAIDGDVLALFHGHRIVARYRSLIRAACAPDFWVPTRRKDDKR